MINWLMICLVALIPVILILITGVILIYQDFIRYITDKVNKIMEVK